MNTSAAVIETIGRLFAERGHSNYGGEAVTQQEHALQAAYFARRANAGPELVAAALLHDVGHLLHQLPDDAPDRGVDDGHEDLGAAWLRKYFGPAVVEPVRLHVPAKQYLCATEPEYFEQLSSPSRQSLQLQGGPLQEAECRRFEASPYFPAAVALRRWDDAAKVPQMQVPDLMHYWSDIEASLTVAEGRTD